MRCVDCLPLIEEYFDGEVEQRTAEQMSAHLASCEDCSAALDALSFEQEVYSKYDRGLEVTPALWSRVSAEIAREPFRETRIEDRSFLSRLLPGFAAALSTLTARPALASSLALLLVGVTAGSLWLAYVRRTVNNVTPRDTVMITPPHDAAPTVPPPPVSGGVNSTAEPSETPSEFMPTEGTPIRNERETASEPSYREAVRPRTAHDESLSEADVNNLLGAQTASAQGGIKTIDFRNDERAARAEDSPAFVKVGGGDVDVVTTNAQLLDPEQKEIARHVEQAQMLLRSIKNARPEGGAFNVAYEKKLSRRLLSENATLQLDAETRGDKDTKQVLDRIEPYLLDIANMHDNASRDEVRSVKERIDRKEIIAALQVY